MSHKTWRENEEKLNNLMQIVWLGIAETLDEDLIFKILIILFFFLSNWSSHIHLIFLSFILNSFSSYIKVKHAFKQVSRDDSKVNHHHKHTHIRMPLNNCSSQSKSY